MSARHSQRSASHAREAHHLKMVEIAPLPELDQESFSPKQRIFKHPILSSLLLVAALQFIQKPDEEQRAQEPGSSSVTMEHEPEEDIASFTKEFVGGVKRAVDPETRPPASLTPEKEGAGEKEEFPNLCGQAAAVDALQRLNINVKAEEIIAATNPAGIFTSPGVLVECLSKYTGARYLARGYYEQLTEAVDAGRVPVVLLSNGSPHWVAVSAYTRNESGKITEWKVSTSKPGETKTVDHHSFARQWENPFQKSLVGYFARYKRAWIDVGGSRQESDTKLPFSTAYFDLGAMGLNHAVIGYQNRELKTLTRGCVEAVIGIPAFIVGGLGARVYGPGERLRGWGEVFESRGGIGNSVLGGLCTGVGFVCQTLGFGLKSIGNAIGMGGQFAGNFPFLFAAGFAGLFMLRRSRRKGLIESSHAPARLLDRKNKREAA